MMPRTALLLAALVACAPPALADADGQVKRTLNADGSVSYAYASPVEEIGTVFGMDLQKAATSVVPATGAGDALTGTAYARLAVRALPDWMAWETSTVSVSLSPTDRSKLATTFARTVPLGGGISAVVADTYILATGTERWETDKSVSLKLAETGTTFSVATKATQETPVFLPTFSAQQKLFGDVSVTTSVADTGSTLNRSITAGFSHRW